MITIEKYSVIEEKDSIRLKDIENFDPKDIFECGQAFRWYREEDGSYTAISYGRVLNVKKEGNDAILYPTNLDDFNNIWIHYFDLERDYSLIKEKLREDPILEEAIEFGPGIRILNQEPFEMVISFIISANNRIPRIKKSIETIAQNYGDRIDSPLKDREYFSFPSPSALEDADLDEFNALTKVGFRGQRVLATSKIIDSGDLKLQPIFDMTRDEGKIELMTLPGVGPKVSDCILLFGFNKDEAFPVDVWVKRVMEHFYLKEDTNVKHIGQHGARIFGSLAGFAQQYLFYYARETGIGRK